MTTDLPTPTPTTFTQHIGFESPYVDVDEWRDAPVRHRYVHGGFAGTDTRFSFYFPSPADYQGRFFQHVTPAPDSENLAPFGQGQEDKISFSHASGAYFVETNGGGAPLVDDPTIGAFRANAASADYSRSIATSMYGAGRVYGYLFGGSGGGYRTMSSSENTEGVWDGFAPYVIGSPMAIPNVFTARMHAMRVLSDRLDDIQDALDVGGSGDPEATLSDEERDAWAEATNMGFPRRAWFGHRTMGTHAWGVLYPGVRSIDPTYFDDFWTVPGYEGADPTASVHSARVTTSGTVAEIITRGSADRLSRGGVDDAFRGPEQDPAAVVAVRIDSPTAVNSQFADLLVSSGAAAGARIGVSSVSDGLARIDFPDLDRALDALAVGDTVVIDNSDPLAAQTYHRHQVSTPDFDGWSQFVDDSGAPLYPQRPMVIGPLLSRGASATIQTGKISGHMIVVASLLDREAFPWQADWYRRQVMMHLGSAADDRFRLWFVDHAFHGDDEKQEHPSRTVSYLGVLQEALRELAAWVERGEQPAPTTEYVIENAQVLTPASAGERRGVQPAVSLRVNGGERAEVSPSQAVTIDLLAQTPGVGSVVQVDWDLDADGEYDITDKVSPAASVSLQRSVSFETPGTYFVTARVTAQAAGDPDSPWARMQDLARVRIVVVDGDIEHA